MTGASCRSRRWVVSLPVSKVQPVVQAPGPQSARRLSSREQKRDQPHAGHLWEGGGSTLALARLWELWVEPKFVRMPRQVCVIFGKGLAVLDRAKRRRKRQSIACEKHTGHHQKCGPATKGSGSLRNRRGLPSPNLGQIHLSSLEREKQFLVELGEG